MAVILHGAAEYAILSLSVLGNESLLQPTGSNFIGFESRYFL